VVLLAGLAVSVATAGVSAFTGFVNLFRHFLPPYIDVSEQLYYYNIIFSAILKKFQEVLYGTF
jgi:hypothetical protein